MPINKPTGANWDRESIDERLRLIYIKHPIVRSVISSAYLRGVDEKEMLITLVLSLAEHNEKLSSTVRKIYETGIISTIKIPEDKRIHHDQTKSNLRTQR